MKGISLASRHIGGLALDQQLINDFLVELDFGDVLWSVDIYASRGIAPTSAEVDSPLGMGLDSVRTKLEALVEKGILVKHPGRPARYSRKAGTQ